ncbi:MAG: hypothetical protein ACFB4I_06285 [Cyanophyceae cyanobacterium]
MKHTFASHQNKINRALATSKVEAKAISLAHARSVDLFSFAIAGATALLILNMIG